MRNDIDLNLALCLHCRHISPATTHSCPVCDEPLHQRKPNAFKRTLSLTLASLFFFIPANIFPIMKTVSLTTYENNTIIDGIFYFFEHSEYFVGIVIFLASVFVPIFKIIVLLTLLYSVHTRSTWRLVDKVRFYRIIHLIGKWSMLDIFVIGLMISMVQFGELAQVTTGLAAISFCAMVLLTMFATESFDTRLLWDKDTNGQ